MDITDLLRSFQAFIFAHEGVLEQDLSIWSFVGIFPQDKVYEAFDLRRSHFQDGVFRDDFVQVIAVFDHEGVIL